MNKTILDTITAFNAIAPECHQLTKREFKALENREHEALSTTDRPTSELAGIVRHTVRTLQSKFDWDTVWLHDNLEAARELLRRDPALFHTVLGIDSEHSRERRDQLSELLHFYLMFYADVLMSIIRHEVPEIPQDQIGSALAHIYDGLHYYIGDVADISEFAQFIRQRAVIEAKKLALILELATPGSFLQRCAYNGIISRLRKVNDLTLWHYKDKDDVFSEFLTYMITGGAEEIFTSPATASMETRIHKYAEHHTHLYTTELIRDRNYVKNRTKPLDVGTIVLPAELRIIKAAERRELEHKGRQFKDRNAA